MTKEKGKDSKAERGGRRTYSPSTKEGKDVWVSQESAGTKGKYLCLRLLVCTLAASWVTPDPWKCYQRSSDDKAEADNRGVKRGCPLSSIPPLTPQPCKNWR